MYLPDLIGNYEPVLIERTHDHPLPVTGAVPPALEGRLLRNGPNTVAPAPDGGRSRWVTGDGMLHEVVLRDGGAVGYRNRFVRTRRLAGELGTPAPRGPRQPVEGAANANVVRHAGVTLALDGVGLPVAVTHGLEHAHVHDFDSALASPMCAHPKLDPDSGELVFFGADAFGPPFLRVHTVTPEGDLVRSVDVDLPRAIASGDFGLTAERAVLFDQPLLFDLDLAGAGTALPYRWTPDAGARVGLLPRSGDPDGASTVWCTASPVFVSHVVNAYDDGDLVVADVIRYDRPPGADGPGPEPPPVLARWTVDPAAATVTEEVLDDRVLEWPRIDPAVAGRPHRIAYCTEYALSGDGLAPRGLVKFDLGRSTSDHFDPGPNRHCGEPVFVRAAEGRAEDEGWVLTMVYDRTTETSDLMILDATSFSGTPDAVVQLPGRVPYGLHGSWLDDAG